MTLNSRNRKSIFLNKPEFSDDRLDRSALIIGGDWVGDEIAIRLSLMGLEVTLVSDLVHNENHGVETDLQSDSIDGRVGQFRATIVKQDQSLNKLFGFVVSAQPARKEARFNSYGLKKGPRVFSISEFEELLEKGDSLPERKNEWYHAAFIDDLTGDSSPETFRQFLVVLERLKAIEKFQAYVFTRHLKVAGFGLEKRYRELRRQGVIFFKFDNGTPTFENESGFWKICFTDPLLKLDFEITPDIIVVDEKLSPQTPTECLNRLVWPEISSPYLQSESPRFTGVLTSRVGLFAVGPSRGVFDRNMILEDIDSVELEIRKILTKVMPAPRRVPVVDKSRCAFCLTCVRLCPHGAITFFDRAEISKNSCLGCGICLAECPMEAISYVDDPENNDIVGLRHDGSNILNEYGGKIALFLCSRSATQAYKSIEFILDEDVAVVEVNCAGSVESHEILNAFKSGAKAVLVAGCFRGNCASVYGNILCENRVDLVGSGFENRVSEKKPGLSTLGINPELIRFVPTASNTPNILLNAISDIKRKIKGL